MYDTTVADYCYNIRSIICTQVQDIEALCLFSICRHEAKAIFVDPTTLPDDVARYMLFFISFLLILGGVCLENCFLWRGRDLTYRANFNRLYGKKKKRALLLLLLLRCRFCPLILPSHPSHHFMNCWRNYLSELFHPPC